MSLNNISTNLLYQEWGVIMDFKIDFPVSKETVSNILEPAIVPLSHAIGGIIHWTFQKPIEYGITRKKDLDYLKKSVQKNISDIPEENRTEENLGLTLKAFEDSRYQLSNELISDFFAKLIASTVDSRQIVKPVYSEILKEMSHEDAVLFKYLYDKKILFQTKITTDSPFVKDDRFRVSSRFKIFLIKTQPDFDLYRDTTGLAEEFYDHIVLSDNVESFLFLLSKQLIEIDENENWNSMIPAVEKKSLDNDEGIKGWLERYKNYSYRGQTDYSTYIYRLSPLGEDLANSILNIN